MTYTLSPYDMTGNLSAHMPAPQIVRRTSRSSGSQPGCRPSRIEKPRSNHNSPRTVERRKTTTGTKLYATLDDHYNMMMGITGDEEAIEEPQQCHVTRPVSWHPSSAQFNGTYRSPAAYESAQTQNWCHNYAASSRGSMHGSDFYSLSARNSMYTEPPQTYPNASETHRGSQDSEASWQAQQYAQSSYSTPATEPMPWYLQEWARKNQAQPAGSQYGSTDFLPIQHPATEQEQPTVDEDMEDSGKELVGMGLYDIPDPTLSWDSPTVEATGKGLKLEETWQPPEEDEDEEEDADDASSEASVEEPPPPPPAQQPTQQIPVAVKPQTPGSMEGQSFFFDEDESVSKEWWFQQLKQPTMPVRDTGIGYGWL